MIMKKTFLIIAMALLGMTQAVAQEYEYVPFVREGVKWIYYINNYGDLYPPDANFPEGKTWYTLELKGDTVINGKTYKAMHKYYGESINGDNDTIPIFLREEDKVVYAIVPDGRRYLDCPLGNKFFSRVDPYSGEEYVLYDFKDPDAFWNAVLNRLDEDMDMYGDLYENLGFDFITIGNHKAKRHTGMLAGVDEFYTVEGIGLDSWRYGTPLCFFMKGWAPSCATFNFSHVIEGNRIIYKGHFYDPDIHVGIDEAVTDKTSRPIDARYYDLMGRAVGTEVPTEPGIYIHQGKKLVIR